jgi:hypothetical protein
MGIDHGWEKFVITLHFAVASPAFPQKRLAEVVKSVYRLERDSFPDGETWDRFEKLITATTAGNRSEETIETTTSQMTDEEAGHWLQEAFGICNDITVAYGAEVARLAGGRALAPALPSSSPHRDLRRIACNDFGGPAIFLNRPGHADVLPGIIPFRVAEFPPVAAPDQDRKDLVGIQTQTQQGKSICFRSKD